MTVSAFVLIDVTGNHTKSVYKTITRIEGVKSLYAVTGACDLIVLIEGDSMDGLARVLSMIRSIDGVTKTVTSIILGI